MIVGAGLGGALAAAVLSRAGFRVVVVDRHAAYPADFRAEQLVGPQTDTLRRLGLLDGIVGQAKPVPSATAASYGRIIDSTHCAHYGLRYEDMVNAARSLAAGATFVTGRVAQVVTGAETQQVRLADGTVLDTRLVILATGPNCSDLLPPLGIQQAMLSENHSLTFGFDVKTTSRRVLVYYGERAGDGMDYLTVFPFGDAMRANLFCYLDPSGPWARAFKPNPKQALLDAMPSLERTIGPFKVSGKVQARPSSIQRARNVRGQAGIVLIGDAYQSSCPAVG
ncbi:MAG: FAD-dependent monooxygenase, partial [Pseudomonadota bacterium]|nr:FAD-dependent monooxygenase [Pseudomonadota bacterium]